MAGFPLPSSSTGVGISNLTLMTGDGALQVFADIEYNSLVTHPSRHQPDARLAVS